MMASSADPYATSPTHTHPFQDTHHAQPEPWDSTELARLIVVAPHSHAKSCFQIANENLDL